MEDTEMTVAEVATEPADLASRPLKDIDVKSVSSSSSSDLEHERVVAEYLVELKQLQVGELPAATETTRQLFQQLLLDRSSATFSDRPTRQQQRFATLVHDAARLSSPAIPIQPRHLFWTMRGLLLRCLFWDPYATNAAESKKHIEFDLLRIHPAVMDAKEVSGEMDVAPMDLSDSKTTVTHLFLAECHRLLTPDHAHDRLDKLEAIVVQAQARIDWHSDPAWRARKHQELRAFQRLIPHFHTNELEQWTRSRKWNNEVQDDPRKLLGMRAPTAALAFEESVNDAIRHRDNLSRELKLPSSKDIPLYVRLPEAWQQSYDPNIVRQTMSSVHAGVTQMLTDPKQRPPSMAWSAERTAALVRVLERVDDLNCLAQGLIELADVYATWSVQYDHAISVQPPQLELVDAAAAKELLWAVGFAPTASDERVWESQHLTPDSLAFALQPWQTAVVVLQARTLQTPLTNASAKLVCRVHDQWITEPFAHLAMVVHRLYPVPDEKRPAAARSSEKPVVTVKRKQREEPPIVVKDTGGVQPMTDIANDKKTVDPMSKEFQEPEERQGKRQRVDQGPFQKFNPRARRELFSNAGDEKQQPMELVSTGTLASVPYDETRATLALHELNLAWRLSDQLAQWQRLLESEPGRECATRLCQTFLAQPQTARRFEMRADPSMAAILRDIGFQTGNGRFTLNLVDDQDKGIRANRLLLQRLVATALVALQGQIPVVVQMPPPPPPAEDEKELKDSDDTEMTPVRVTQTTQGRVSTELQPVVVSSFRPNAAIVDALVTFRSMLTAVTPTSGDREVPAAEYADLWEKMKSKAIKVPGLLSMLKFLVLQTGHTKVAGNASAIASASEQDTSPDNRATRLAEELKETNLRPWPTNAVANTKELDKLFFNTKQAVDTKEPWVDGLRGLLERFEQYPFRLPKDHPRIHDLDHDEKHSLEWRMNVDYALYGTRPMESKARRTLAADSKVPAEAWAKRLDEMERNQLLGDAQATNIATLAYVFFRHVMVDAMDDVTAKACAYAMIVRPDLWRTIVRRLYRDSDGEPGMYRFARTDLVVCLAAAIAANQRLMLVADGDREYLFVPPTLLDSLDAMPPKSLFAYTPQKQWLRFESRTKQQELIRGTIEAVLGRQYPKIMDVNAGVDALRIEMFHVAAAVQREQNESSERFGQRLETRLRAFANLYHNTSSTVAASLDLANVDVQSQLESETFLEWITRVWRSWHVVLQQPKQTNARLVAGMGTALSLIHIGEYEQTAAAAAVADQPEAEVDLVAKLTEWIDAYGSTLMDLTQANHPLVPLKQRLAKLRGSPLFLRLGRANLWKPENQALQLSYLKVEVLDRFFEQTLVGTRNQAQRVRQRLDEAPLGLLGAGQDNKRQQAAALVEFEDSKRAAAELDKKQVEQTSAEQWMDLLAIAYTYHSTTVATGIDVSMPLFQAMDETFTLQWQSVASMEGCRDKVWHDLKMGDHEGKDREHRGLVDDSDEKAQRVLASRLLRANRFSNQSAVGLLSWIKALVERPQDKDLRAAMVRFVTDQYEKRTERTELWTHLGKQAYPEWTGMHAGLRAAMTLDLRARVPGIHLDREGAMVRPLHVLLHGQRPGTFVLLLAVAANTPEYLTLLKALVTDRDVPWSSTAFQVANGMARIQAHSTRAVFRQWLTSEVVAHWQAKQQSSTPWLQRLAIRCGLSKQPTQTVRATTADIAKRLQQTEQQTAALAQLVSSGQDVTHAARSAELQLQSLPTSSTDTLAYSYVTWNQALSFRLLAVANDLRSVFAQRACDSIQLHARQLNQAQQRKEFTKLAKEALQVAKEQLGHIRTELAKSTTETLEPMVNQVQNSSNDSIGSPAVMAAAASVFHLKQALDAIQAFVQWVEPIVLGKADVLMHRLHQQQQQSKREWTVADVLFVLHQHSHAQGSPLSEDAKLWQHHVTTLHKVGEQLASGTGDVHTTLLLDAGFGIDSLAASSSSPLSSRDGDGKDAKVDRQEVVVPPAPISRLLGKVNEALTGFWKRAHQSRLMETLMTASARSRATTGVVQMDTTGPRAGVPAAVEAFLANLKTDTPVLHTVEATVKLFKSASTKAIGHLDQMANNPGNLPLAVTLNVQRVLQHYVHDVTDVRAAKSQSFSYLAAFLSDQCATVVKELDRAHFEALHASERLPSSLKETLTHLGMTVGDAIAGTNSAWERAEKRQRQHIRTAMSAYYVAVLKLQRVHRLVRQLLSAEAQSEPAWKAFSEHVQAPVERLMELIASSTPEVAANAIVQDFQRFASTARKTLCDDELKRMMDAIVREQGHLAQADWGQAERKKFELAWASAAQDEDSSSSSMSMLHALRNLAMGHASELTESIRVLERQQLGNEQLFTLLTTAAMKSLGVCAGLISSGMALSLPNLRIPDELKEKALAYWNGVRAPGVWSLISFYVHTHELKSFADQLNRLFDEQCDAVAKSWRGFVNLVRESHHAPSPSQQQQHTSNATHFYDESPNANAQHLLWTSTVFGSMATYAGSILEPRLNRTTVPLSLAILLGFKAWLNDYPVIHRGLVLLSYLYQKTGTASWSDYAQASASAALVLWPTAKWVANRPRLQWANSQGGHLLIGTAAWSALVWTLQSQTELQERLLALYRNQSKGLSFSIESLLTSHPALMHMLQPTQTGLLAAFFATMTGAVRVLDEVGQSALETMAGSMQSKGQQRRLWSDIGLEYWNHVATAYDDVRQHVWKIDETATVCFANQAPNDQQIQEVVRGARAGAKLFYLILNERDPPAASATVQGVEVHFMSLTKGLARATSTIAESVTQVDRYLDASNENRDAFQTFMRGVATTNRSTLRAAFGTQLDNALEQTHVADNLKILFHKAKEAVDVAVPEITDWNQLITSWQGTLLPRAATRALVPVLITRMFQVFAGKPRTNDSERWLRDKLVGIIDLAVCCGITPVMLEDVLRLSAISNHAFGPLLDFMTTTIRGLGTYLAGSWPSTWTAAGTIRPTLPQTALARRDYWRNQWFEWQLSCGIDFMLPAAAIGLQHAVSPTLSLAARFTGKTATELLGTMLYQVRNNFINLLVDPKSPAGQIFVSYGGWCGLGLVSLFLFYRIEKARGGGGQGFEWKHVAAGTLVSSVAAFAAANSYVLVGGYVAVSLALLLGRGAVKSWFRHRHQEQHRPIAVSLEDLVSTAGRAAAFASSVTTNPLYAQHPLDNRIAQLGSAPSGTATAALQWLLTGASNDPSVQQERDLWAAFLVHGQAEHRAAQATNGELPVYLSAPRERMHELCLIPMIVS